MIGPLVGLAGVFVLLVLAELLWYQRIFTGEVARKFVHMLVGIYVAFWPLFMSMRAIAIMSLAFLAVLAISKRYKVFRAMHNVERKSWGDILFAFGIGITATVVHLAGVSQWMFTIAILHLACADGLAAVLGSRAKHNKKYLVFKQHTKSLVGSMVFWLVSLVLLLGYSYFTGQIDVQVVYVAVLTVPLILTIVENISVYGSDNVLIPLSVILLIAPLASN